MAPADPRAAREDMLHIGPTRPAVRWGLPVKLGVVLLGASRSLPLYRAGAGATASDGRPLAGAVVRLVPMDGGVRIEVLAGNGAFRRGDALVIRGADPVGAIRG